MNENIIQKLNSINQEFYKKTADHFHTSRNYYWKGWEEILPFFADSEKEIQVLDVGCGNGRFGLFLQENLPNFNSANFIGIDSDDFLLEKAKTSLPDASFFSIDIVTLAPQDFLSKFTTKFDLISLFGVLHHIPSYEKRLEILKGLKTLLASSGKLIFSTWEFTSAPNFPKNTLSWEKFNVNPAEIEENDYLLTWSKGVEAVRYCHYISPEGAEKLCQEASLKIIKSYKTDAKGDEYNRYFITGV